ncbi:MAG: hypothetical protein V2A76_01400 [Planctomycetota bacterium]
MPEYSQHQKGIIKRYYENRDTIALQKLAETVSDLYLENSPAKRRRAWKSALTQMLAAGVPKKEAEAIVLDEDLGAMAKIVEQKS